MVIKRIAPLSAARITATVYAVFALPVGSYIAAARIFRAPSSPHQGLTPLFDFVFGSGAIILLPLVYAALGFVITFLAALLYNFLASIVGGIQIDVE